MRGGRLCFHCGNVYFCRRYVKKRVSVACGWTNMRWERASLHCSWMYYPRWRDSTTAEIAVVPCLGRQQGENEQPIARWCLRHTRTRPSQGGACRHPSPGRKRRGVHSRASRLQRPMRSIQTQTGMSAIVSSESMWRSWRNLNTKSSTQVADLAGKEEETGRMWITESHSRGRRWHETYPKMLAQAAV